MNLRASNIRYTKNFNIEKMEPLLTLWVNDLNRKEFLSLSVIWLQKPGVFLAKFNKRKVETRHSLLAEDGLQGSSNARKFIA